MWWPCWGVLTCRRRLFFDKNDAPEICMTCNIPVEVFLHAEGAFSPGKPWLTNGFGYICDGRGITEARPLKGLDSQMALALAIASLWYKRLSPSKGVRGLVWSICPGSQTLFSMCLEALWINIDTSFMNNFLHSLFCIICWVPSKSKAIEIH